MPCCFRIWAIVLWSAGGRCWPDDFSKESVLLPRALYVPQICDCCVSSDTCVLKNQ
jgi:hypothetical protein